MEVFVRKEPVFGLLFDSSRAVLTLKSVEVSKVEIMQKMSTIPLTRPWVLPSLTTLAVPIMVVAVAALSLAAIFIRLSEQEIGPFATLFNRFWIAFVVLWGGRLLNRWVSHGSPEPETYTFRDILWIAVSGTLFWGCLCLWAVSLLQTPVANSTILHNLTPLFTTLGAWVLLHRHFDKQFLLGLSLALAGALSLGLGDLHLSADTAIGDGLALLSAVLLAGNLMVVEKLRSKFSATTIILWCCLVGAVLTLPFVLLWEDRLFPISTLGWTAVIGLAILCQIVGQGLQAYSLKRLSSGLVGVLLLLDPVLAALIAAFLFFEHLTLVNWIGFLIILGGIYLAKSSHSAEAMVSG